MVRDEKGEETTGKIRGVGGARWKRLLGLPGPVIAAG